MHSTYNYPCNVRDCGCAKCGKTLTVIDNPYENADGQSVYPAMCNWLSPPEPYDIPVDEVEAYLRDLTTPDAAQLESKDLNQQPKPTRRYHKSKVKDWNQEAAAALLGISTRQLRNYAKNPPDGEWPGWEDPVALRIWHNNRIGATRMAKAIKHHLPLREGGVTERGMVGSIVPAKKI